MTLDWAGAAGEEEGKKRDVVVSLLAVGGVGKKRDVVVSLPVAGAVAAAGAVATAGVPTEREGPGVEGPGVALPAVDGGTRGDAGKKREVVV